MKVHDWNGVKVSTRLMNAIKNKGCETVDDVRRIPSSEWLATPNFGLKSAREIMALFGSKDDTLESPDRTVWRTFKRTIHARLEPPTSLTDDDMREILLKFHRL